MVTVHDVRDQRNAIMAQIKALANLATPANGNGDDLIKEVRCALQWITSESMEADQLVRKLSTQSKA